MITEPRAHGVRSTGQDPPVVTMAAMLIIAWLFPSPGCPESLHTLLGFLWQLRDLRRNTDCDLALLDSCDEFGRGAVDYLAGALD